MKRATLLVILLGFTMFAQEHAAEEKTVAQEEQLEKWRILNFAILAGALGYGIYKTAGPFFRARSEEIRRSIADAEQARADAEARIASVEARLANISAEIEEFRRATRAEQSADEERMRRQTEADLARIQEHSQREIEAAGKMARLELKRYSAQLALELAERRIARQMTPQTQDTLVRGFVRDLAT